MDRRDKILRVFCGIDWAKAHHDVALVDDEGTLIAKRRISDDAAGFAALIMLLADAGDSADDPIPVAIETSRGLLVACLRATGRRVYAINPMAVSRYRDRHSVARKKSDAGDALVLAHILRTDQHAHRPLPADSDLAQAIAVLARAVLAAASTPRAAAKLTKTQLRALLRRAGRERGVDAEADRLQAILRADYLRQLPLVEDAFGRHALALLHQLNAACASADELACAVTEHFDTHPDAPIITSQPGLGALTGARVLAEIGDDRSRFRDARALKAYAGSAPVTRASGKSLAVMHRRIKNQRLAATGYLWAFAALTASPG